MSHEYEALLGVPLVGSLALLALATCSILLWEARVPRGQSRKHPTTIAFVDEGRVGWSWPVWLLVVTLVFLAANQLLVRGVAVGTWDVDGQFYPYYVLVADHARAGRFVQWDPWSNGGLPLLGDPQVGAFSPVHVVLGFVTGGTSWGFRIYWLLMWWLGGVGMLLLGRHLKAPPWGACVVALGFLFCGVYTGNAEHTPWITAFSFLPVTIWRLDVALGSHRLQPAAEAGALWGLSALAGYPGVVIITGCFAALWTLGRWLLGRWPSTQKEVASSDSGPAGSTIPTLPFAIASLALVLLVGILVLFPTYAAFFYEGAGTSPRVGALTRAIALGNSLEPGALATFASPYLTALKVTRQFLPAGVAPGELWPATDLSMVNIYAGPIIPSLALFGLIRRPRDRWRWWVICLGLVSLACAMGETLPLRGWLYDWFYPLRFFRHSAIFRLYYLFCLCVLALLASRDLSADLRHPASPGRRHFLLATLAVASLAILAVIPFMNPAWHVGMPEKAVLLGRLHFVWIWLVLSAVALLGWTLPTFRRESWVPVLLVALAASDTLLTSVLSIPTVLRVGEAAQRWRALDEQHRSNLDLTSNGLLRNESSCPPDPALVRCRSNDQLITKVPVFNSYSPEKNVFQLAMVRHPILNRMATGADRIWFSKEVARVPAAESVFAVFRRRAEELGAPPLVIHSPDELLHRTGSRTAIEAGTRELGVVKRLAPAERIHADVVRYRPQELVFNVRTAVDGWLLITDRWARSWQAEVNGRPVAVYGGNFIFRALPISAGLNRVRFTYQPLVRPWLVAVSWAILSVIGLAAVRARMR